MTPTGAIIAVTSTRIDLGDNLAAALRERHGYHQLSMDGHIRALLVAQDPQLGDHTTVRALVGAVGWGGAYADRFHGAEVKRLVNDTRTALTNNMLGPNLLTSLLAAQINADERLLGAVPITLTDVHTASQARWVHDMGGVVWHATCDGPGEVPPIPVSLINATITMTGTPDVTARRIERELARTSTPSNGERP